MKKTEKDFRKSQPDWEEIFQAIGHPTFILSPQYEVMSANRAAFKATGLSKKKLIGQKCFQLMHRTDEPPHVCPLEKMIASGRVEMAEMEVTALEGDYLISCTPIFDKNGQLEKVIHIATDISKQKQAEQKLKESERIYRSLFENANDSIYLIDPKTTRILDCNKQAAELDGYTIEELKQKTAGELHPPDELKRIPNVFKQVSKTGKATGISGFHHLRKDGSLVPIEVNASIINIGDKKYNLSIVRDISERKQTEEKITKQLRQKQQILETTLDGFILADAEGKLIDVNKSYCDLIGYSKEELLNMNIREVEVKIPPEEVERRIQQLLAKGDDRFETKHKCKDGRVLDLEVSISIMQEMAPRWLRHLCVILLNRRSQNKS